MHTQDVKLNVHNINPLTPPTVTNYRNAEMPACRSLIHSHKAEISAWKFREKTVPIMLCLGAPGLGTPCCGSSGVRGLTPIELNW